MGRAGSTSAVPRGPVPARVSAAWERSSRTERVALLVASVATVLPIWVAAVRVGLRGLVPVGDTAIMALRAPDVLSSSPPLIGMPASSASGAEVVHFPAAWQLYWMAVPVEVLGATWGTVVAMAALNTVWIGLAIWLVVRNLEPTSALWTIAGIGVFCWSIGSGMLIEAWPLRMVLVPFLCVVIAAWCTALGDRAALVVLAGAANFAWLDHLVLVAAVPLVALAGCAGLVAGHVRAQRADPESRARRRRRLIRGIGAAAAVTFVMWLPPLIQQVTGSPGNLGLLLGGSSDGAPAIHSGSAAVHVVAGLIGHPPFWLRGSLEDPTFYRAHLTSFAAGSATWADLVVLALVAAAFTALGVLAVRRRDRVGLALLGVAAAAIVASGATVYLAPVTTALVPEYLYSVWVTALVTWLAVIVNVIRSTPLARHRAIAPAALALAVVAGLANLATSPTGYTADTRENELARAMSAAVIAEVGEDTPVEVTLENTFEQNANVLSALLVGFQEQGVAFCYPVPNTSLYDFIPDCGAEAAPRSRIVIADKSSADPPSGEVIFSELIRHGESDARTDAVEARLEAWLAARSALEPTAAAQRPFLGTMVPEILRARTAALEPSGGNLAHLVDDPAFHGLVLTWWDRSDARNDPLFVGQPVSPGELHAWAAARREADWTLWVTRQPVG